MQRRGRPDEVARLAGVAPADVARVEDEDSELLLLLQGIPESAGEVVIDALMAGEAHIWVTHEGEDQSHFWYDDALFGDVVPVGSLAYTSDLGLHVQRASLESLEYRP